MKPKKGHVISVTLVLLYAGYGPELIDYIFGDAQRFEFSFWSIIIGIPIGFIYLMLVTLITVPDEKHKKPEWERDDWVDPLADDKNDKEV